MKLFMNNPFIVTLDATGNDNSVFVIEQWAQDALIDLEENMIAAHMVHRDYEDYIAREGETVTAWVPGSFLMKRKTDDDDVTVQAASSVPISVKLNQHLHVSYIIKDGEESKSYKKLRDEYITPAAKAIAKGVDQIVLGQVYQFKANAVGKLGTLPTEDTVIDAEVMADELLIPTDGRNMILTPKSKGSLLKVDEFKHAEKRGDGGKALRDGEVGRVYAFNTYMCQQTPSILEAATSQVLGAINNGTGYAIGIKTFTVDTFAAAVAVGTWVTIAGDDRPRRVTAATGTPCTEITVETGLDAAVVDNAVVTSYKPGAVNLGAGYAIEYAKDLVVDGFTTAPATGQMVTFVATAEIHCAIQVPTTTALLLDTPLVAAVADNAVIGVGPAGNFNFIFHKHAVALVTRPLATPEARAGALSYVAKYGGLAMRVTITYEGRGQGHLVTIDMLCGVKTLNTSLGMVMYG